MIPVAFTIQNAYRFGGNAAVFDFPESGTILIHDTGLKGSDVIIRAAQAISGENEVTADLFDDPGKPLCLGMSFKEHDKIFKYEKIFYAENGLIRENEALYEWKTSAGCYVPADDLSGDMAIPCLRTKKPLESVRIWDLAVVGCESENITLQPDISYSEIGKMKERIPALKSGFEKTGALPEVTQDSSPRVSSLEKEAGYYRHMILHNNLTGMVSEAPVHDLIRSESVPETPADLFQPAVRYADLFLKREHLDLLVVSLKERYHTDASEGWDELMRLMDELNREEEKRQQHEDLMAGISQIERKISKTEDELKLELHSLAAQMNEKRPWVIRIHDYEKELELHHRELVRLQKIQDRQKHVLEQGLLDKTRLEFLERWIEEHKAYVDREHAALESIHHSVCPDCQRELESGKASELKKTIQERMESINGRIFQYQIEMDEIRHTMEKLRGAYAEFEKEMKQQPVVWHQYYTTEIRLQTAKQSEKEYQALREQSEKIRQSLTTKAFARHEQSAVEDMQKQILKTAYQPSRHRELRQRIRGLLTRSADSVLAQGLVRERRRLEEQRMRMYQGMLAEKSLIRALAKKKSESEKSAVEMFFESQNPEQLLRSFNGLFRSSPPGIPPEMIQSHIQKLSAELELLREKEAWKIRLIGIRDRIIEELDAITEKEPPDGKDGADTDPQCAEKRYRQCLFSFAGMFYCFMKNIPDSSVHLKLSGNGMVETEWVSSGRIMKTDSLPEQDRCLLEISFRFAELMIRFCGDRGVPESLWIHLPFLLHDNIFISNILAVVNHIMFWIKNTVLISHHPVLRNSEWSFCRLVYDPDGITVSSRTDPQA